MVLLGKGGFPTDRLVWKVIIPHGAVSGYTNPTPILGRFMKGKMMMPEKEMGKMMKQAMNQNQHPMNGKMPKEMPPKKMPKMK